MKTDEQLKKEIEKWLGKIELRMPKIIETDKNEDQIANIKAYISDCKHFREEGNLVLSFEAIIWAWAWLQILGELKMITEGSTSSI